MGKRKGRLFKSLIKFGYKIKQNELEDFLKNLSKEEYSKFLFSRNLSQALKYISDFGKKLGLEKCFLDNLKLQEIFKLSKEKDILIILTS